MPAGYLSLMSPYDTRALDTFLGGRGAYAVLASHSQQQVRQLRPHIHPNQRWRISGGLRISSQSLLSEGHPLTGSANPLHRTPARGVAANGDPGLNSHAGRPSTPTAVWGKPQACCQYVPRDPRAPSGIRRRKGTGTNGRLLKTLSGRANPSSARRSSPSEKKLAACQGDGKI
jgi:hypothetical protein